MAAVALTITMIVSGCSSGAVSEPSPTRPSQPSASAAPANTHVSAPACPALATPDEVVALVGGTGEPQKFEHLQSGGVPASWAVLASNGAVCGWGVNALYDVTGNTGSPSVFVQLMPGLESAWNTLTAEVSPAAGASYDGGVSRGGQCTGSFCSTDVLVDGAWLSVKAGAGAATLDEASFHRFVQGMISRFRALPAPTVEPPHAPRSCDDAAVRGAVEKALGAVAAPNVYPPAFTLEYALQRAGYRTFCMFFGSGDPHVYQVEVTVIAGADAGLLQQYRTGVDHPEAQAVDASSLPGSASALAEYSTDSYRTIVDVLDDGYWVDVVTYPLRDSSPTVALAGALVTGPWVR